jgi:hypothetical protein
MTAIAGVSAGPSAAIADQLFTVLNGMFEVPQRDAAFVGAATVQRISSTKICYGVLVDNIDEPTLMHIHKGPPGVAGPIVVTLTPPKTGEAGRVAGCVSNLDKDLVKDLFANPVRYYINVHTVAFGAGAVRGPLFKYATGIPDPE